MASLVFEDKVKAWEKAGWRYVSTSLTLNSLNKMAIFQKWNRWLLVVRSRKKKELDERIMQLKPFARGIANKDPKLWGH